MTFVQQNESMAFRQTTPRHRITTLSSGVGSIRSFSVNTAHCRTCQGRRWMAGSQASELNRSHRSNPAPHLGGILFIHVKEMGHDGFHCRLAAVIRLHGNDAAEDLERTAFGSIPVALAC